LAASAFIAKLLFPQKSLSEFLRVSKKKLPKSSHPSSGVEHFSSYVPI
jgi:hypothetical protein